MPTRRRLPAGLRWRLTGWVAVVMLLAAAVTFAAVYRGTGTQLRGQIDRELAGDASELAHRVAIVRGQGLTTIARTARSYVRDQPFRASSTLLFAEIPRMATISNQPELFAAAAPDDGESPSQQARENRQAKSLGAAGVGYSTIVLPDVGQVRVLKQTVPIDGSRSATIGVGEPLAPVDRAEDGISRAFLLAGALVFALALLASYFVGARVSRPLRRIAAVAARVDAGDLAPRIHEAGTPGGEMRTLADAFNHMLDRLDRAFSGQRAFVADASHELRTPLTVIRGQLEVLGAQEQPSAEELRRVEALVQREVGRMSRLVDDLLLLANSEQARLLQIEAIDLRPYVEDLWSAARMTAERRFELAAVPAGTLLADPDRVAQALRNIIRNAVEHTAAESGLVSLDVEELAHGHLRFAVEDDGPGIAPQERELVFERFHRTDSGRDRASGGSGLGLAIVRAVAEAHGGAVRALPRAGGGTRIELDLPRFSAA